MLNNPFPVNADAADAAMQAHERLADSGRKVVASPTTPRPEPEQATYKRWECSTAESDEMRREYARMPCPDCGTPMDIRTSRSFTMLIRERHRQCPNVMCGSTFRSLEELVLRINPGANPNPKIDLPVSERTARNLISHQMQHARVGEHPPLPGAKPVTASLFDSPG
ncbi:ogr/Delta-like zinc finger family protein [Comamonas sp. CMM02]|uniref:ogr/Delta-like zinc finger family protein n=1 Tax=Comamonas sp. CMM02 TaxID=2769307 RepID=UPI0017803BE4|nr:ogr/Delta-like zinc finger family protein [Comamonas sp. CMM02]MBD9400820.1 ogr/Delta-like zinc finger family protein [Comamonas sp. CMM02]